jgi:uncharacterized protein (TIGR02757 family)
MKLSQLKIFLDEQGERFEKPDFLAEDPLGIVHRFHKTQDQEIVGLLSSTIAWGNRKSIIKSTERILECMDHQPYNFLKNTREKDWQHFTFVHRTFNTEDLLFFFRALKNVYEQHESLEVLFSAHASIHGVKGRIVNFRTQFLETPHFSRTEKHISNPLKGSSSKRLNMFLRWMVRDANKNVDLGIWKNIPKSELRIPLDVHTSRVARKFNMTQRKQDDWRTLEEIHLILDELDPNDPAKYDFALFGLGVEDKYF